MKPSKPNKSLRNLVAAGGALAVAGLILTPLAGAIVGGIAMWNVASAAWGIIPGVIMAFVGASVGGSIGGVVGPIAVAGVVGIAAAASGLVSRIGRFLKGGKKETDLENNAAPAAAPSIAAPSAVATAEVKPAFDAAKAPAAETQAPAPAVKPAAAPKL